MVLCQLSLFSIEPKVSTWLSLVELHVFHHHQCCLKVNLWIKLRYNVFSIFLGEHVVSIYSKSRNISTSTVHLPNPAPPWLCLGHLTKWHFIAFKKFVCCGATTAWDSGYQDLLDLVDLPTTSTIGYSTLFTLQDCLQAMSLLQWYFHFMHTT